MNNPTREIMQPDPLGGPQPPQVEILSRAQGPRSVREPLHRARRFKVFAAVFLLVVAAGSIWNFTRPAIYRATATVLVEAPDGIGLGVGSKGADLQNVAAQRRVLLAREMLEQTLERATVEEPSAGALDPEQLRAMLDVQPTPQTNLVELSATGSNPGRLAALVNAWIGAYLAHRQEQIATDVAETVARIQDEYDRLDAEKQEKTRALDDYRRANEIDTMERQGNQALARLKSLTTELNDARAKQVEAAAEQEALEAAIARGEPVVAPEDQPALDDLQQKAAELRSQLRKLNKRYTDVYLQSEPNLRELPRDLEQVESRIAAKLAEGKDYMRSKAARDAARAQRQVQLLSQQLAVARSEASRFTEKFSRYERLKADLDKVDELHRGVEARLVDVKAKAPERYRQVEVLDPAFAPKIPLQPHYWRDQAVIVGVAALAALLAVLLLEFLTRRERDESEMQPVTGVRVFAPGAGAGSGQLEAGASPEVLGARQTAVIQREETQALPTAIERELLPAEVRALTAIADPASRQLIGLILGGLSPEECARLDDSAIDLEAGIIRAGADAREIPLCPALAGELAEHTPRPLWSGASGGAGVEALIGRLSLLAHDAGLSQPGEVSAAALRHSYICYLVRQGARLTEIERVIGTLPAAELGRYGAYSPAGPAKPLGAVDLCYPAFDPRTDHQA